MSKRKITTQSKLAAAQQTATIIPFPGGSYVPEADPATVTDHDAKYIDLNELLCTETSFLLHLAGGDDDLGLIEGDRLMMESGCFATSEDIVIVQGANGGLVTSSFNDAHGRKIVGVVRHLIRSYKGVCANG